VIGIKIKAESVPVINIHQMILSHPCPGSNLSRKYRLLGLCYTFNLVVHLRLMPTIRLIPTPVRSSSRYQSY